MKKPNMEEGANFLHRFIRELRLRFGISQKALGARVGLSGQKLSRWERGQTTLNDYVIINLGKVLRLEWNARERDKA